MARRSAPTDWLVSTASSALPFSVPREGTREGAATTASGSSCRTASASCAASTAVPTTRARPVRSRKCMTSSATSGVSSASTIRATSSMFAPRPGGRADEREGDRFRGVAANRVGEQYAVAQAPDNHQGDRFDVLVGRGSLGVPGRPFGPSCRSRRGCPERDLARAEGVCLGSGVRVDPRFGRDRWAEGGDRREGPRAEADHPLGFHAWQVFERSTDDDRRDHARKKDAWPVGRGRSAVVVTRHYPCQQRDHVGGATAGRHQHRGRRSSRLCSALQRSGHTFARPAGSVPVGHAGDRCHVCRFVRGEPGRGRTHR